MKRHQPPALISAQRLARFCKVARLWLLKGAGWLIAIAGLNEPLGRAVDQAIAPFTKTMKWVVLALIMLMAQAHMPAQKARRNAHHGGPPRRDRVPSSRTVYGSRLRKLVKAPKAYAKDPRAIIAALLKLLEHAEVHALRLARRLRNGLMRRRGGFSRDTYIFRNEKMYVSLKGFRADTS